MNNRIKKILISIIAIVYVTIMIFFVFIKRPVVSELENRKLAEIPKINIENYMNGSLTNGLTSWFDDTVPFRDTLVNIALSLKKFNGVNTEYRFKNVEMVYVKNEDRFVVATKSNAEIASKSNILLAKLLNNVDVATESEPNKTYTELNGIIITGKGKNSRAITVFPGLREGDEMYAITINMYKEIFKNVNIYSMLVPTAMAYYCPEDFDRFNGDQKLFLDYVNSFLRSDIKIVDAYSVLNNHKNENIYLRTDHHWTPLGAYYAAEEFAKVADVPYFPLKTTYKSFTMKNFVGSLYRKTEDEDLKKYPENFTHYEPIYAEYETEQCVYPLDGNGNPIGKPDYKKSEFFQRYSGGKSKGYLTFMGGDNNTTHIKVSSNNTGRNLLILKDSYGNPIPSYLIYDFDNIHIVDYRYFLDNVVNYVNANAITDILFVNNVEIAMRDIASKNYRRFLVQ